MKYIYIFLDFEMRKLFLKMFYILLLYRDIYLFLY